MVVGAVEAGGVAVVAVAEGVAVDGEVEEEGADGAVTGIGRGTRVVVVGCHLRLRRDERGVIREADTAGWGLDGYRKTGRSGLLLLVFTYR